MEISNVLIENPQFVHALQAVKGTNKSYFIIFPQDGVDWLAYIFCLTF